jgi:serine phosphatase RsbU (regulator of sigma subunit)
MRDGVERLGVLSVTATAFDETLTRRCEHLTSLVALLLVSKLQYDDTLVVARRSRPMTLAAELRWALLPPLSAGSSLVSIAAVLEPAYEVAGDAFDYAIETDTAHVAVFDAMGHGLESARIANLAVAAYRHARRLGADVADIYSDIDSAVSNQFGDDRFCTGQLALLDVHRGWMRWVNAGHPGPLLIRQGRVVGRQQAAVSLPFGFGDGSGVVVNTMSLEPGDRVVFYTDGLTEARSEDGQVFGEERLVETIASAFSEQHTPAEALRRVIVSLSEHRKVALRDDATAVMLWWRGPDR